MNILVFGGHGTIGKPLVKLLNKNHRIIAPNHKECDLLEYKKILDILPGYQIDLVLNLAAKKTNILLNKTNSVDIYRDTVRIGLNIFELCRIHKIPRLIQCVCSCSYAPTKLLKESEFDIGVPDQSVLPHAHAKRQLYYMAKFYKQQYELNTNTICFNNVYGKLEKTWDYTGPDEFPNTNLKVLDAIFVKMLEGKRLDLWEREFWGTGKPRREFIYYEDVARAINEIVNQSSYARDLINIGIQEDISIKKLAKLIKKKLDYKGDISFMGGQDGQMKKLLDSSTFRYYFPDFKFTTLEEGIDKMIETYV